VTCDLDFTGNLITEGVVLIDDRLEVPFFQILRGGGTEDCSTGSDAFIQGITFPSP
jgi:hypothetical protein